MTRSLLLVLGAVLAGAPGCAGVERAPRPGAAAPSSPGAGPAARRSPATPAVPGPAFAGAPTQVVRDRGVAAAACRRDADRAVLHRDRGQLMREDERDARIGTDSSIYAGRIQTDRLGRAFERDRIAAECLDQDPRTPPSRR